MEKSEPANPAVLIKEKLRQMFAIRQRMRISCNQCSWRKEANADEYRKKV